ncbi:MAG: hypothetical protein Q7R81_01690 [Candidatus Peregrinibacteria bacterium]|nr:hypothetical protein [Candidatus Peregrinibacteria bacterium]
MGYASNAVREESRYPVSETYGLNFATNLLPQDPLIARSLLVFLEKVQNALLLQNSVPQGQYLTWRKELETEYPSLSASMPPLEQLCCIAPVRTDGENLSRKLLALEQVMRQLGPICKTAHDIGATLHGDK